MIKKILLAGGLLLLLLIAGAALYITTAVPPLPPDTDEVIDQVLSSELPQLVTGQAGFAQSGESAIWYEMLEPEGPPQGTILLVMGIGADGLGWPPAFLQALVGAGYQVVRYDQRGTGMSDWVEEWDSENPYTLHDMADDGVAILDDLGIEQAHLVGISMGGMTAQQIAVDHPDRVLTLATVMSSCDIVDPNLPSISIDVVADMTMASLKYGLIGGERDTIKQYVAARQALMGDTPYELDTKNIAEQVLYNLRERRGFNPRVGAQHNAAVLAAESRYEALRQLDIPTLVLHGRSDPFIPYEHGQKCAEIIPGAEAVWVEGMGHDIPDAYMDVVVENILANLARSP
jgi:pimeloyl-ACP methyl ester carboxylesterase